MKKIIIAFALLCVLTGCGSTTDNQTVGIALTKNIVIENATDIKDTPIESPTEKAIEESVSPDTQSQAASSHSSTSDKPNPSTNPLPKDTPLDTDTKYVTVSIDCLTILHNMNDIKENYLSFIPKDGYILKETKAEITDDDTALSILKKVTKEQGIKIVNQNGYISIIQNIPERIMKNNDGGWMFFVNGKQANVGAGSYKITDGDEIRWRYTSHPGDM